jgi:hypothetical protein
MRVAEKEAAERRAGTKNSAPEEGAGDYQAIN